MCSASLCQRGGTPWLTLSVESAQTAWSNSNIIPLYRTPGSAISGDIVLKLDKPEVIQAVKVSIRGTSSFTNGDTSHQRERRPTSFNSYTFMDIVETLWSSTEGIPKFAEPPPYGYPKDGKLQGKFTFHFTLRLPQTIALDTPIQNDHRSTCALPSSWSSKRSSVAVDYAICVTVVRGALKANTILTMTFCYSPRSQPSPSSVLRQQANAAGTLAPDPLGDPAGWYTNPPTKVKGKFSSGRSVDIVCSFSLAKPLSYSRGKYIPMNLAVQCSDKSILDLFLTPRAVSVTLLQCIYMGKNACSEKHRFLRDAHVSAVARAVWWQSPSSIGECHDCRTLMGEIELPMRMPATTISPRAVIQYSVVMFPFDVAGFTASDPHSFIVDQPVQITTHDADGPSSCSQAPPGYVDPRREDFKDRLQLMKDAVSIFR